MTSDQVITNIKRVTFILDTVYNELLSIWKKPSKPPHAHTYLWQLVAVKSDNVLTSSHRS